MLNSFSSNAILTKVHAIFGKRLTPSDFSQMARKSDVGEVAAFLKENPSYQKALKNINETEIHRGQLESLIKKDLYYKYSSLRRYDFSDNGFYDFILTKVEVDEILRCLMLIGAGQTEGFIIEMPSYLMHHTSFNLMVLTQVKNLDGLIEVLSGTPYAAILKRLRREDGTADYLRCEFALYSYYYQFLFDSVDQHFRGGTKKALKEIMQAEIEAHNVEIIFRLKYFHHMDAEQIKPLLFPYRYHLNDEKLEKILGAKTIAEMTGIAKIVRPGEEPRKGVPEGFMEFYTHSYCYHIYKRQLHGTTKAAVAMYAFIALRNIEVQNIITVIEGVRYGQPQDEILSLLIL